MAKAHIRLFIYITDLVELVFRAITKARYNSVYNLGNPEEISIKELAVIIMKKMRKIVNAANPSISIIDKKIIETRILILSEI